MNFLTLVTWNVGFLNGCLAIDFLKTNLIVRRRIGRLDDPDSRRAFEDASPRATSGRLTRRRPWMDRARRRRSAGLPLGAARATHRSGPGWAAPKIPQMGPGASGGPTPL